MRVILSSHFIGPKNLGFLAKIVDMEKGKLLHKDGKGQ
jgi:hypothetical protein